MVSYQPFDPFATPAPLTTADPHEYLDSLIQDVKDGTASREQLEGLLKSHYQGEADPDTLVAEGLAYLEEQLGEAPTETPEATEEPLETLSPAPVQEETEGGIGAAGWIIGAAVLMCIGGGGYAGYTALRRRRREEELAAARKRSAQNRAQAGAGSAGARSAGTAGAATAAGRIRNQNRAAQDTGNPPKPGSDGQNGRTKGTEEWGGEAPTGTPAARNAKPYSGKVDNPYRRYSTHGGEEETEYTASFRPGNGQESSGTSRRRARSERYSDPNSSNDSEQNL